MVRIIYCLYVTHIHTPLQVDKKQFSQSEEKQLKLNFTLRNKAD